MINLPKLVWERLVEAMAMRLDAEFTKNTEEASQRMSNTGNFCFLLPTRKLADKLVGGWTAFVAQSPHLKNLEVNVIGAAGPSVVVGDCDRLRPVDIQEFLATSPELKAISFVVDSVYGDVWKPVAALGTKGAM